MSHETMIQRSDVNFCALYFSEKYKVAPNGDRN